MNNREMYNVARAYFEQNVLKLVDGLAFTVNHDATRERLTHDEKYLFDATCYVVYITLTTLYRYILERGNDFLEIGHNGFLSVKRLSAVQAYKIFGDDVSYWNMNCKYRNLPQDRERSQSYSTAVEQFVADYFREIKGIKTARHIGSLSKKINGKVWDVFLYQDETGISHFVEVKSQCGRFDINRE